MKQLATLLLAVLLLPTLAACGKKQPASEDFLSKANAVEVTADAVSFTDALGEKMTLSKHPTRVVSLYTSFTTLWYEAGGSVIGCIGGDTARELYTEYIGRDITADADTRVLATASNAKKWNIEEIFEARPDLILCSTAMSGYETLKSPAKAAGIPLVAVDYDDFADYLKWFKIFAHLNGREDLWESVALAALAEVTAVLDGCPTEDAPRVLCLFSGQKSLQANTANTVLGGMLDAMRAHNLADSSGGADRIEISLEAIYAADPDILLIQCHAGVDAAMSQVESLYGDNPVWQSLRAVKDGRVYYLEKALFHNKPNRRFAEAYAHLAKILYG